MVVVRPPAVVGSFYPQNPTKLREEIERCLGPPSTSTKKSRPLGIVVPHAGYQYSGGVAGLLYGQVEIPERLIILSPNHTGFGPPISLWSGDSWETPLGAAKVDQELSQKLKKEIPMAQEDTMAHQREHSLEVQIPFLQYLKKSFSFVPLTLSYLSYGKCESLGRAIAEIIKKSPEPILIIASSDLNHYENQAVTEAKDLRAIERIVALDPQGLYQTVQEEGISMCGIIPTTITLVAVRELGGRAGKLVRHATSGDVTGEYSSVVGYASLILS